MGRSIQEMGSDVVIGRSIYEVVVIDGSLYSRFYGMSKLTPCCCELEILSSEVILSSG